MMALRLKSNLAKIWIIILFLFIITLPFLNRAIAVDDIYILAIADHVIEKPLDPYNFDWYGQNRPLQRAYDTATKPPLVPYYLGLMKFFFGNSEVILHTFFMVFSIVAAISMFYLSKRFTKWPLAATLLLISIPIFSVTSHNFMLDLPVLTFFLLSCITFINGVDNDKKISLVLSGLFVALAFLTKYNAIILFPLLISYALLRKKAKYIGYLSLSLILILIWSLNELYHYGSVHSANIFLNWHTTGNLSSSIISKVFDYVIPFLISNLSYIGGGTIFFIFLIYPFIRKLKDVAILFVIFVVNSILAYILYFMSASFLSGQYNIFQLTLFVIFATSSSFFIVKMLESLIKATHIYIKKKEDKYGRAADKIFLGFCFFLGFIFHTIIAGGNARYLTILLPPLILFYFLMIQDNVKIYKIKKSAISFVIILTIVLSAITSLAVSVADYQYAEVYRDFAKKIPYSSYSKSNIIFTGHEGFKYYMEQRGYTFYDPYTRELQKGDILITPKIPVPRNLDSIRNNLTLLGKIKYSTDFPVRTNNPWSHAGFYVYANGVLPFSFSNGPLDIFEIYEFR